MLINIAINTIKNIILYAIKFKRLSLRFLIRLKQTWYIGFLLGTVYTILTIVCIKYNVYQDYKVFLPATISTLLTIYLIDFLRIEYERKRDANKRYLFNLIMLSELTPTIDQGISNIFQHWDFETKEDLKVIADNNSNFWDEQIEYHYKDTVLLISKKQYLRYLLNEIDSICKSYLSNYLSIANYDEYKLIHNLRINCLRYDPNNHLITGDIILDIILELFDAKDQIDEFYNYWFRDGDISSRFFKKIYQIKALSNKIFCK
ncbi:hypothetical protein [Bacillus subtilis]|uniref:hypothetical protein n=1 Tax=Bacillus subtilis TaxID=1423 RepID=UPI002E210524|nr:hypothetical protein [Bacillus subtilis]